MPDQIDDVLIIGAGPAGLSAAYWLTQKSKQKVRVLETHPTLVGGISRTETYNGFRFDVGGHRFFTKSEPIEHLWREILPQDFLQKSRLSRIYYNNKFYAYPLKAFEALLNLGFYQSGLCVLSYLYAQVFPVKEPKSFADWVSNKFGSRLFRIFFKTYTEKVWGMSCDALSADWAAQRIKGLNLFAAVWQSLIKSAKLQKKKSKNGIIKTLTESFYYPRLGPGMMWESATQKIIAANGQINMNRCVTSLAWDEALQLWEVFTKDDKGAEHIYKAKKIMSSAALSDIVPHITPRPQTAECAKKLAYRDFITVALMLKKRPDFDDNWIYVHDASVAVGRIQNFTAWSADMVSDQTKGCIGLEYFCNEGDGLWQAPDNVLIDRARLECTKLGLIDPATIEDGHVVRQLKAYPVYDAHYLQHMAAIRAEFEKTFPSFHFIGRNGMHKYDNQDHAMMTGLLAAENIMAGHKKYDVWAVNEDAAYLEEKTENRLNL